MPLGIRHCDQGRARRASVMLAAWLLLGTGLQAQAPTNSGTADPGAQGARAKRTGGAPWIAKAREAESLLMQEDGVRQALAAYERLEREIPNQPPLILRCAQLADQLDQSDLALFHYRRYLNLAGQRARQEARDRAATLELNQDAKQGAERLARDRKVNVQAVQTPTVVESGSIMAALGDDSSKLVEIRSEQDFTALQDPARRQQLVAQATQTPKPVATNPTDDALVASFAARAGSQPNSTQIQTPTGQRPLLNRVTVREGDVRRDPQPTGESLTGIPDQAQDGSVQPALAPLEGDSNPQNAAAWSPDRNPTPAYGTAISSNQPQPTSYQPAPFQEGPARRPASSGVRRGPSGAMVSDGSSQGGRLPLPRTATSASGPRGSFVDSGNSGVEPIPPQPGELTNVPPADEVQASRSTPSSANGPVMGAPIDPRQRFFTSRASTDGKTRLRLSNNMPETILTFAALSEGSSAKADAILATGESRVIEISPAAFEIRMTIMSMGYPPSTLTDRRFRMRLNAGTEYSVRITPETLQRLN